MTPNQFQDQLNTPADPLPADHDQLKEHICTQVQGVMNKLGHSLGEAVTFTGRSRSQISAIRSGHLHKLSVQLLIEVARRYAVPLPPDDQIPVKPRGPAPAEKTQQIHDHYVIHCIKKHNYDGHEITPAEIEERRALILERRKARTAPKTHLKKLKQGYIDNLTDHYVRTLLVRARDYGGEPITAQMIEDYREGVLAKRHKRGLS